MKRPSNLKKTILVLEQPLSKGYYYYGIHFQAFLDKRKDGLTPLNSVRFLEEYSRKRKHGNSGRNNLRKAIIHIVKLTLMRERIQHEEIYYREALKIYKIRQITKTVTPNDVPTPEDIKLAKSNSPIRVNLVIDFVNITTLRIGESVSALLANCRFDKPSKGYIIKFVRKGGNIFETWIPKELYDRIVVEFGSTVFLFQSPYSDKRHISPASVQRWLRNASKFTTRPVRPHLIRHKAINDIIKENPQIPRHILCDVFGHTEATNKGYYANEEKADVSEINRNHYYKLREMERL